MTFFKMLKQLSIGLLALPFLYSCTNPNADNTLATTDNGFSFSNPLSVYSVNNPLAAIATRIGGDLVDVRFSVPADEDPAYWQPDANTIIEYQAADVILLNGAGYARWLSQVTLPEERLVNTGLAFRNQWLPIEEATTHSHGLKGIHSHQGYASTTWLDFELAAQQADAIATAFIQAMPDHQTELEQRRDETRYQLLQWDKRMQIAAKRLLQDEAVIFSHPVYQYFKRRYELDGRSLHWEPDMMPTDSEWLELDRLIRIYRKEGKEVNWMLWESEPLAEVVTRLSHQNIGIIVLNPQSGTLNGNKSTKNPLDLDLAGSDTSSFWPAMERSIADIEGLKKLHY